MVNIQSYLYELFSKRTTGNKISNCHCLWDSGHGYLHASNINLIDALF